MKLYVSTYAKYNSGSLAGAWLDLNDYPNADAFEKACRKLHRDERDPELMFQDYDKDIGCDWQEGLYSESAIPRDYWTLKAEFEAKERAEAQTPAKGARAAEKARQKELLDRFMEITRWEEKMRDYFAKGSYFITLSGGEIMALEKPSIETRFCCGEDDHGQGGDGIGTMAFAHKYLEGKRTERGFKSHNLDNFDRHWLHRVGRTATLRRLRLWCDDRGGWYLRPAYIMQHDDPRVLSIDRPTGLFQTEAAKKHRPAGAREINDEDIRLIRAGYAKLRADFKKRLDAYWKRFGNTKIHTWTYWTQR